MSQTITEAQKVVRQYIQAGCTLASFATEYAVSKDAKTMMLSCGCSFGTVGR